MEASLIQFKCTKYFRDDLTLVFQDGQCFNSISIPVDSIAQLVFVYLQCQINMNLVFHISEDGSEIKLTYLANEGSVVHPGGKQNAAALLAGATLTTFLFFRINQPPHSFDDQLCTRSINKSFCTVQSTVPVISPVGAVDSVPSVSKIVVIYPARLVRPEYGVVEALLEALLKHIGPNWVGWIAIFWLLES